MRRLEFYKCSVCSCYWNKNLTKIKGYRPTHIFSKYTKSKFVKFICKKCSDKLYDLNIRALRNKFLEEWKFKRVNNKVEKIESRTKNSAKEERDILRIKKRLLKQDDKIKKTRRQLRELLNKKIKKLTKQFGRVRSGLKSI